MESLLSSEASAELGKLEASLDPLEWMHSDVHELIFQHFKPEDSLRASLVSKAWNEDTEVSMKCWEKLELNINYEKTQEINRPIAEDFRSSRKYQKLIFKKIDDIGGLMSVIRRRKWRSVKMEDVECELVKLKEILNIVEPTVQTLHIMDSKFYSPPTNSAKSDEDTPKLKYPKLKDLLLYSCDVFSLKDIFGDCKTLEKLDMCFERTDPAVNDGLIFSSINKLLENNAKLEKLSFRNVTQETFPIQSTLNHRFKLKSFSLVSWSDRNGSEDRVLNFLKSQANNLEELKLYPCTGLKMLQTILKMPKLMKVGLRLPHELIADRINVDFNRNLAIEDFSLNFSINFYFDLNETFTEFLVKLFQSIPNCQRLYVNYLNGAALQLLAQHCPKIKELEVWTLDVEHIDELPDLPDIRFFFSPRINKALKTLIREKPAEARTRLERLISRLNSRHFK